MDKVKTNRAMRQWPCESNGYFCITRFYLRTNGVITNTDP
ncbi:hypothetical protein ECP03018675_5388, partial [Escherichia coli P0301867.5]